MSKIEGKKTVSRLDSFEANRWMTTPFTRTADGFLSGRAIVTSVGVFTYLNKDGSESRELRLPEEVFDRDSLETMKLKPVANDHPTEKITDENIKKYQVGSLGSNPTSTTQMTDWSGRGTPMENLTDGFHVAIDMIVNDSEAINDVLNGKRALSMGYECELEAATGVWCGMEYDGIQRKIRYNHCAIVDQARAGDEARIRMDSADAVRVNKPGASPKPTQEVRNMKKINLDGVEYEGEEKLIEFYQTQKKRADAAESALTSAKEDHRKALSAMEAERDAQKERADKADKDLKELREKSDDTKRLDAAVSAKLALLSTATKAGVECKDGMTDAEIKRAIITAVSPSAKLDGRDEAYIQARFDAAVEILEDQADEEARPIVSDGLPVTSGRSDSVSHWQKMVEDLKAQSRGETK
jgi:hypothetical protein